MAVCDKRDAGFFAAVHCMLERDQSGLDDDRRGGARLPYQCMQLIAPIIDGQLPDQSQFQRMQCQDLSQSGFSFLSPDRPDYTHLVVALGAVPFTFLSAEVIRKVPLQQGQLPVFLVGCRFLGRITG